MCAKNLQLTFFWDDWWLRDEIKTTRCCQKVWNFNLTTATKRNLVSRRQINVRDYERDSVYSLCLLLLIRMTISAIWMCLKILLVLLPSPLTPMFFSYTYIRTRTLHLRKLYNKTLVIVPILGTSFHSFSLPFIIGCARYLAHIKCTLYL